MAKPKFTDAHKYPHGYVDANSTSLAATFARIRREQKAAAEREASRKTAVVQPMKRGKP